ARRFEVAPETLATFREAMAKIRRDAGAPLDDDAALLLIARHILTLGGPSDTGRANYQVAMIVCADCRRGWQQGAGDAVEVRPEIVAMANCDAQDLGALPTAHVGETDPVKDRIHRAHQHTRPAARRTVVRRDGGRCVVPGCRNAIFVDIHHIVL